MPRMPRKWVEERAPSPDARHCDIAFTPCDAPLTLRLSPSAIRGYEWLVLVRCERCDAEHFAQHESAPAVHVVGVLPEAAWGDMDPADCDGPHGV